MKTIKTLLQSFKNYSTTYPNQEIVAFTCNGDVSKYVVEWRPPVSKDVLEHFFEKNNWYIPSDLKEFYLLHNGGILFKHPYYGGGIDVFALKSIQKVSNESVKTPKHWYPIAWADFSNGGIYMDSNRCKSKQYPYMFYLGGIDPIDEAIEIHSDFTTWLARLLACHGEEYWLWNYDDRLTFKS